MVDVENSATVEMGCSLAYDDEVQQMTEKSLDC